MLSQEFCRVLSQVCRVLLSPVLESIVKFVECRVQCCCPVISNVWLSTGKASDYEEWLPHETMKKDDPKRKGCLLGQRTVFQRLKHDSW